MRKAEVCVLVILLGFVFATFSVCCACKVEKDTVTECLFSKLNFNKDNEISEEEIDKGVNKYMSYMTRFFFNQIGGADYILGLCDGNGDGVLSRNEDMPKECLSECDIRETILTQLKCNTDNKNNNNNNDQLKTGKIPKNTIEDGLYCAQKTFDFWMMKFTIVATAKVENTKQFQFRLNGDIHLSWCNGNVIKYVDNNNVDNIPETMDVQIKPSECMKKILSKYSLHIPIAKYVNNNTFELNIKAFSGFANVGVTFTRCSKSEAVFYINNYDAKQTDLTNTKKKTKTSSPSPTEL
jgi:hypothetical protein